MTTSVQPASCTYTTVCALASHEPRSPPARTPSVAARPRAFRSGCGLGSQLDGKPVGKPVQPPGCPAEAAAAGNRPRSVAADFDLAAARPALAPHATRLRPDRSAGRAGIAPVQSALSRTRPPQPPLHRDRRRRAPDPGPAGSYGDGGAAR